LKFIEDDFLSGRRLDPATDGRPDPRPDVRENAGILGELADDFDFSQPPRPPVLLPVHPVTTLTTGVPYPPRTPSAVPRDHGAAVGWGRPWTDGGLPITAYVVTPYVGGFAQPAKIYKVTTPKQTIAGLRNSTTFTFKVAAINANGVGPSSLVSNVVTVGTPTAPQAPHAVAGDGRTKLSWLAPTRSNGAPITGYVITPYSDGIAQESVRFMSTATSDTIAGLPSGTAYTFTVAARNSRGVGPASSMSAVVAP
jgi:hypothetical protein